eukprot:COSAG02_NODE_1659_length_11458_cov_2.406638_4_plen_128_part_00
MVVVLVVVVVLVACGVILLALPRDFSVGFGGRWCRCERECSWCRRRTVGLTGETSHGGLGNGNAATTSRACPLGGCDRVPMPAHARVDGASTGYVAPPARNRAGGVGAKEPQTGQDPGPSTATEEAS